jgi:hypothetical protein
MRLISDRKVDIDLYKAIEEDNILDAIKALKNGAYPNIEIAEKIRGELHGCNFVAEFASIEMLELLLEYGLDPNGPSYGCDDYIDTTVFMNFLNIGNIGNNMDKIRLLLDHGADVFVEIPNHLSPEIKRFIKNEKMKRVLAFLSLRKPTDLHKSILRFLDT